MKQAFVKPLPPIESLDAADFSASPRAWLAAHADGCEFLLAHALDGVIWGRVTQEGILFEDVTLRGVENPIVAASLQEARLFGGQVEVRVWRADKPSAPGEREWRARRLMDAAVDADSYEETYWLWGTREIGRAGDFALVEEAAQKGMRHAPPITTFGKQQRAALRVKHYLAYDDEGQAYVALSRLVGVEAAEDK